MIDIETLGKSLMGSIEAAKDLDELEAARIAALGKQGAFTAILKTPGAKTPEERVTQGHQINLWKAALSGTIAARKTIFENARDDARLAAERIDLTLPAPDAPRG